MLEHSKREIIGSIGLLAAAVFVYRTRDIWLQIIAVLALAAFFALVLTPVCSWLERKGLQRSRAALAGVAALLLVLVVFVLVFVPYLVTHSLELIRKMTPTVTMMLDQVNLLMAQWGISGELGLNLPQFIASAVTPLTTGIARGGMALASAAGNLAMALIIGYYLLTVRREAGCHLLLCMPTRYRRAFLSALSGCKNAVLSYLSGLIKTCAFVAGATLAGLVLLGIKEALILALFMGLLEVLPYIGPILGMIPILLSVIPMGMVKTLLAVLMVIAIQQIESGVIGPYFTASSTSIHPLSAIMSVFIGGCLFGLLGIVFAVPLLVVARSVLWSVRSTSIQTES